MNAPGITHTAREGADEYFGTAQDLIAAGLVTAEQLPGAPGLPRTIVRIRPDGSTVEGHPNANKRDARTPGAKWIARRGRQFSVTVLVTDDERVRRRACAEAQRAQAIRLVQVAPRLAYSAPRSLRPSAAFARGPRAELQLVWSGCSMNPRVTSA